MSELKPCPFCGNKEIKLRHVYEYPYGNKLTLSSGYVISCNRCNLDMNIADKGTAIKAWNTREETDDE